ncbi:MAG: hypothetical protein ACRD2G_09650 [Terriglobia bacterium]
MPNTYKAVGKAAPDSGRKAAGLSPETEEVRERERTYKFPETYIFDRNGRLADKIIGATDWTDPEMIQFVKDLVHWPPRLKQPPPPATGSLRAPHHVSAPPHPVP